MQQYKCGKMLPTQKMALDNGNNVLISKGFYLDLFIARLYSVQQPGYSAPA
jgi:hypothetical protein